MAKSFQNGKANRLEALLKQYAGSTVIAKVSGSNLEENESRDLETTCRSLVAINVLFQMVNSRLIAVHGAGPQIYKAIEAAGLQNKKVNGLTYTDGDIYKAVEWAVNKARADFSRNLRFYGARAELLPINFVAATSMGQEYGGRVGKPKDIKYELLKSATKGSIPVASSWGIDFISSLPYNINADDIAALLVARLKPALWINVTPTGGILADKNDTTSIVPRLSVEEAKKLTMGGMAVKVNAVRSALDASPETRVAITSSSGIVYSLFRNSGTTLTYK